MENYQPKVSIIIPVFNRDNLILESLESIFNQTYQNFECLIIDDHSTDNTFEVIADFIQGKLRFTLYKRPNNRKKGANACRNYGLEKSNGEFVYWFDSDDIAHPRLLEKSLKCIEDYQVDYCRFSREIFFGSFKYHFKSLQKKEIPKILEFSPSLLEKMLTNKIEYNTCNVLWRKASLEREKFNEDIVYADEWEFYSRLLIKKLKGVSINRTLIYGRKHNLSTTYEFRNKNTIRRNSKIKAIKLVLQNIGSEDSLTPPMKNYFLRLGFELNSFEVIKLTLNEFDSSFFEILKYKLGFKFYPVLKPIFYLKGKLK